MNNSANHSKLVNQVLLEFHKRHPKNGRLWKAHTGMSYTPESIIKVINYLLDLLFDFSNWAKQDRATVFKTVKSMLVPIKYGMVGQADLTGVLNGRRIEIEIKTGKGTQSEDQKNFEKMINDMGGCYIVVRELKDLDQVTFLKLPF